MNKLRQHIEKRNLINKIAELSVENSMKKIHSPIDIADIYDTIKEKTGFRISSKKLSRLYTSAVEYDGVIFYYSRQSEELVKRKMKKYVKKFLLKNINLFNLEKLWFKLI